MEEIDPILKEIEGMGSAFICIADAELILGRPLNEIERMHYIKGVKMSQVKLNKVIIDQAVAGSKPAQDMALALLDNIKMNNDF